MRVNRAYTQLRRRYEKPLKRRYRSRMKNRKRDIWKRMLYEMSPFDRAVYNGTMTVADMQKYFDMFPECLTVESDTPESRERYRKFIALSFSRVKST